MLNETGYSGRMGKIFEDVDATNLTSLNNLLKNYGLKFIIAQREIEMLVLE